MGDEMWKQNLEEWVMEEGLPVTYKYVAQSLGVHVNIAKKMLFAFHKDKSKDVEALYLVAGRTKDQDGSSVKSMKVVLIHQKDLKAKETSVFDAVTSKHIFAVAKKPAGKDGKSLLNDVDVINMDLKLRKTSSTEGRPQLNTLSGIKNKNAIQRPRPELPDSPPKKKPVIMEKKPVEEPKKKGIQGMFEKQSSQKPAATKTSTTSASASSSGSKAKGKTNNIASMFAKAPPKKEKPAAAATAESTAVKLSPDNSPGKENEMNKKTEAKAKSKASKRPSQSSSSSQSKRRKRIQVMSDSEEEEEQEEAVDVEVQDEVEEEAPPQAELIQSDSDDEDIVPATPEPEVAKSKKAVRKGRRRVKKMVDKTFMDEKGYMVTKKQLESCSETDDDDQDEVKKEPVVAAVNADKIKKATAEKTAKNNKTALASSSQNKQASIMSFFKRN